MPTVKPRTEWRNWTELNMV